MNAFGRKIATVSRFTRKWAREGVTHSYQKPVNAEVKALRSSARSAQSEKPMNKSLSQCTCTFSLMGEF